MRSRRTSTLFERAQDRGGILGDTSQTGILDAVASLTGGRSATSVRTAFGVTVPGRTVRALGFAACQGLGLEDADGN